MLIVTFVVQNAEATQQSKDSLAQRETLSLLSPYSLALFGLSWRSKCCLKVKVKSRWVYAFFSYSGLLQRSTAFPVSSVNGSVQTADSFIAEGKTEGEHRGQTLSYDSAEKGMVSDPFFGRRTFS
jgi:hypothetical protein